MNSPQQPARPRNLRAVCQVACQHDDLETFKQAIAEAPGHQARFPKQELLDRSFSLCLRLRSSRILSALLDDYGVDAAKASARMIGAGDEGDDMETRGPPYEILNILLAHGWDINTRGNDSLDVPLLWRATGDPQFVDWCLDHGASVDFPGEMPPRNAQGAGPVGRETVLERAARNGTPETFEKLRAKGAPIGQKTLHNAVLQAAYDAPKGEHSDRTKYEERLSMVRHLIDVVKLDVNAYCGLVGSACGTPLYTVARCTTVNDTRDLIWLLLDRGADPDLEGPVGEHGRPITSSPLAAAETDRNELFLNAVRDWRARHAGGHDRN